MKSLDPPDSHYLSGAIGWLGLGNWQEADEEFEKIAPELRAHPDVLEVRWQIYAKAGKWDKAAQIAATLVDMQPNEPGAWISLAYATRRKPAGGLLQAKMILTAMEKRFPEVWLFPYNLACYCAQLGLLDECQEWFKKALAIDQQTVKRAAMDDPDLQPLRDIMGGTLWQRSE